MEVIPVQAGWAKPLRTFPAVSKPRVQTPVPRHTKPRFGFGSLWEVGSVALCHGPGPSSTSMAGGSGWEEAMGTGWLAGWACGGCEGIGALHGQGG